MGGSSGADPVRYSFSGHETFPFRYTWLPKGVRGAAEDPHLFSRDDAIELLGVGKNMVRSIRHWCDVMTLIEPGDQRGEWLPTPFGQRLFGEREGEGWDPYLEDPATPWLLHWKLVTRLERASSWFLAFTKLNLTTFSRDELIEHLVHEAHQAGPTRVTASSMRRDVDVLIRTYVPTKPRRTLPLEDTLDCPLVELGLVEAIGRRLYRFVRGRKPSLHDAVVRFAILDYWQRVSPERQTLSFEALMHGPGSPGAVFKLSENALCAYLENLPASSGLRFDDTAGVRQLLSDGPVEGLRCESHLSSYYNRQASSRAA